MLAAIKLSVGDTGSRVSNASVLNETRGTRVEPVKSTVIYLIWACRLHFQDSEGSTFNVQRLQ